MVYRESSRVWRRATAAAACCAGLLLATRGEAAPMVGAGHSAAITRGEYEVKAAFLYKLALFVEWPPATFADPAAPFTIGVLGHDPFGARLDSMVAGKAVHRHGLRVRRFDRAEEALGACHVLFISASEKDRIADITGALASQPVLTIGDTDGYAGGGVMINLTVREGSVRFEINQAAVSRAGLRVSSQLLDLAAPAGARPLRPGAQP